MASRQEETASFVLRLSQKIFEGDDGGSEVQWRGSIRHVQSGEEARFSNFTDAQAFVQAKLTDLTMQAVEGRSEEEQTGILAKSFDFWKRMAVATPKLVLDSIKDPKGQAAQLQGQIQEQIHQLGDALGQRFEDTIGSRMEVQNWLAASKSDYREVMQAIAKLSAQVAALDQKVEGLKPRNPDGDA